MTPDRKAILGAIVRFALVAVLGDNLLDHGISDATVETIVNGIVLAGVLAWSIVGKVRANKALAVAKAAPAEPPIDTTAR